MDLMTPGGVKLDGSYSATSWQTVVSVGAVSRLNSSQASASSSEIVHMYPDIARIVVLRIRLDSGQWSITTNDIEIVECDIGLAAYRYSNLSSSGNGLNVGNTESLRLDPGIRTSTNTDTGDMLVFTQTGLPVLKVSVPDITALQTLFTSNRFSGNIYDGISTYNTPSGIGDALREDENKVGKLGTGVRSKKELKNLADTVEAKLEFHEHTPKMYLSQEDEKQQVKQEVREVTEV
ncbi:hypothetical protein C8A00DRAFT_37379 [Chaetomidium leptoderma]|uniref:Uncharacterized protein n=1 Tax=Chaetomidium leptoderma TaxID=669021 RepID=A0AAN6ZV60_9PEZI|nr:hypothetical protein C8A00DRAFT_37379 [Chaetomidium leptoderma]